MAVPTIYRIAEQAQGLIEGASGAAASTISIEELKITAGQVINKMLKMDYLNVNMQTGETIPNGTMLALYEDIEVTTSNGKSQATLPIKPIGLPRNMGIFAVYPRWESNGNYEYDQELIPLQMGQGGLIKSQPLLNDLLGQVGYENFGNKLFFTKDIKSLFPDVKLAMRLAVLDISQYDDWTMLPIPAEMEADVIAQVVALYVPQPTADKVVDSSSKELKGIPVNQQKAS